jgi:polysaccharide biosynthesis/export protein
VNSRMPRRMIACCLVAAATVSACTHLPASGPQYRDVADNATVAHTSDQNTVAYNYVVVDIDKPIIHDLAAYGGDTRSKQGKVRLGAAPTVRVGSGDVLQVSIFEASTGGLFLPSSGAVVSGNFVKLPLQTVGRDGTITVPYAGSVRVAGKVPHAIERVIKRKLSQRAIEPQVLVNIVEQNASAVTVVGDALRTPGQFKISGAGDRVLDVISKSGGLKYPGHEVFLTLQRNNRKATIHFPTLVDVPNANIYVQQRDILYAYRKQRTFVAVGALGGVSQTSGLTGLFPFKQEKLSLNEALAKAGGLEDTRANPAQVLLYRVEYREMLERMGIDLRKFDPELRLIPTVYRGNFRDPSSFFFAQKFQIRDKDIIYAANSDSTEVEKFLGYVRTVTSTVAGVSSDAKVTRDVIVGWNRL